MAKIYPFGSLEITVEAGSQLYARSESEWQLYQIVGAPNSTEKNKLISEVAENAIYSSGVLAERTKYRLDAHESALYWGNTSEEVDPESDIYNQGGTGAVDRTVVSKLQEIVSVKDFGAIGDGVTDDIAAFTSAAATGKTIFIPSGTYTITIDSGIQVSDGTSFVGEGSGSTALQISGSALAQTELFTLAGNNAFEGLTIEFTGAGNFVYSLYKPSGDNIILNDIKYDGGGDGSNWQPNVFIASSSSNSSNALIQNCTFENINWLFLKSNSQTTNHNNWKWLNTIIKNFYRPATFNTPNGEGKNWTFDTCTYDTAITSGDHLTGCAGGYNFKWANSTFKGTCDECIHLEESDNIIVADNYFEPSGGSGIFAINNSVGGPDSPNNYITITGNIFAGDATAGEYAIGFIYDAVGVTAATNATISGNVIYNFENGIRLPEDLLDTQVTGNIITNCTIGIRPREIRSSIHGNSFRECPTAVEIVSGKGGILGHNTFYNCDELIAVDQGAVCANNFDVIFDYQSIPNGSNDYIICPLGSTDRLDGKITANLAATDTKFRGATYNVIWDGTTLTDGTTPIIAWGAGVITATGLFVTGGNLVMRFNNTSTADNVLIDICFNGAYVVQ